MRRILVGLLLATNLLGQTNVSVFKIDTERTLLNKAADVAPKIVQRHTYYLADDGRQRHEITQVATGKTTVEITLWAEHRQIMLDLQTKQATVQSAPPTPPLPTGRMGAWLCHKARRIWEPRSSTASRCMAGYS